MISFIRNGKNAKDQVIVVCNFTPTMFKKYKIGLPKKGKLKEIFNSDHKNFGGSHVINSRQITIKKERWNDRDFAAEISLPPLGITVFEIKE